MDIDAIIAENTKLKKENAALAAENAKLKGQQYDDGIVIEHIAKTLEQLNARLEAACK